MAEKSINLPATSRPTSRNSGNSRRSSVGQGRSTESEEKVPHYLRASTGSCHDFCKYGRKHAFEEMKVRLPFPKRITKKLPDENYSVGKQAEKKSPVAKNKSAPDSGTHLLNTHEISEREPSTKSVDVIEKKKAPAKELAIKSLDSQNPVLENVPTEKKSIGVTKSPDSQSSVWRKLLTKKKKLTEFSKSHDHNQSPFTGVVLASKSRLKQEAVQESVDNQGSTFREVCAEKKTSGANLRELLPDSKTQVASKVMQHVVASSEKGFLLELASSKAKEVKFHRKHSNSLKSKLSSPDYSKGLIGRRNSDVRIPRKGPPEIAVKRVLHASPRTALSSSTSNSLATRLASPRASLSPRTSSNSLARGLASPRASFSGKTSVIKVASLSAKKHRVQKIVSPLKSQDKTKIAATRQPKNHGVDPCHPTHGLKEPSNGIVQERTLYVIKMEAENRYLQSDYNENVSYTSSAISSHEETDHVEDEEGFKAEQKRRHSKAGGKVSLDNKDDQPMKLRFRRGKIIEIKPENNSPRRLKFRRGRVLGQNQNLKADGRRFSGRRVVDSSTDAKTASAKVVLRHQDVQGTKDAQGLLNNVIEETASKLVETRKSKVKALVGAFETVISLQDIKPSANTIA